MHIRKDAALRVWLQRFPRRAAAPIRGRSAAAGLLIQLCEGDPRFTPSETRAPDSSLSLFLICLTLLPPPSLPADPYVKASLVCDGRRLKKRKTSIKKNTLNPTYNEALVFDIPNENIESVSIVIAVMDYDW